MIKSFILKYSLVFFSIGCAIGMCAYFLKSKSIALNSYDNYYKDYSVAEVRDIYKKLSEYESSKFPSVIFKFYRRDINILIPPLKPVTNEFVIPVGFENSDYKDVLISQAELSKNGFIFYTKYDYEILTSLEIELVSTSGIIKLPINIYSDESRHSMIFSDVVDCRERCVVSISSKKIESIKRGDTAFLIDFSKNNFIKSVKVYGKIYDFTDYELFTDLTSNQKFAVSKKSKHLSSIKSKYKRSDNDQ